MLLHFLRKMSLSFWTIATTSNVVPQALPQASNTSCFDYYYFCYFLKKQNKTKKHTQLNGYCFKNIVQNSGFISIHSLTFRAYVPFSFYMISLAPVIFSVAKSVFPYLLFYSIGLCRTLFQLIFTYLNSFYISYFLHKAFPDLLHIYSLKNSSLLNCFIEFIVSI